jgi:cytochrome c-type biogenesis protein CcmE
VQNDPPRGATAVSTDIVEASYTGVVPDTFKDEAEVVLHGQLTPTGFKSDNIIAKCPSKYEAKEKFDGKGAGS